MRARTFSASSSALKCSLWFSGVRSPSAHWPLEAGGRSRRGRSVVAVMVSSARGPVQRDARDVEGCPASHGRRRQASSGGGRSAGWTDHAAGAPEVDVATAHQAQLGAAGARPRRGRAGNRHLYRVAHRQSDAIMSRNADISPAIRDGGLVLSWPDRTGPPVAGEGRRADDLSMARLRTVSPSQPGITRRRQGRGFVYLDNGRRVDDPVTIARIRQLVIPPAWQDVWICRYANGHIQAVGSDDKGRRQYLYHPVWREQRDRAKHDRVLEVAARLPRARQHVERDLALPGMPRSRALATAFRLLDLGFFRIGGEAYAEQNNSYGLATIQKQHVSIEGDNVVFDYVAKSGQERYIALADDLVRQAVRDLLRRRGGGPELLAYRDGKTWRDVTSADINTYIKEKVGEDVSAKDFRTWHGTVIAAV